MEEQRQRVIDRAWKLQGEREKAEDEARVRADIGRASAEVGLDPELLKRAELDLAREDAQARARRLAGGLGALAGLVIFGTVAMIVWPTPPFEDNFTLASNRWVLDKNSGTEAGVDYVTEGERGEVAVVRVEKFVPGADGTYQANLDRTGQVDVSGLGTAVFSVRGEGLGVTRLYLETGAERWRSPPVSVTHDWTEHTVPLSAFDHQVREGGKWQTGGASAPGTVDTVSFKLGHYMNEASAQGEVRFDDLRLE